VFPCKPHAKTPLISGGFRAASDDPAQISLWWERWPHANVGIATGASGLVVVDVDHGLTEDCERPNWLTDARTFTVRTGRRPEVGLQLYFQADGSRNSAGWSKGGLSGDIRAEGGYVMAAGSIHPSGAAYAVVADDAVAPVPEWVKDLAPAQQKFDPATAVGDATADSWKTWLLEYCDHYEIEVRDYEKRVANGWWLGIKCPWEHESGDGAESSTVLGILDGKVAFQCQHGTCMRDKRATAQFKVEITQRNAASFKPEPGADPVVIIGKPVEQDPDDFEPTEESTHPEYPDDVWKGTPYGDFADYCTGGNYIRKRFFVEALRTVVGAVVGGQLSTDYQGVNARAFTVLIGPPGSGKGTAITAARQFIECEFDSQRRSSERPLLWDDAHDPQNWCWPARNIGAHVVSPASAPGLIQATKPHKLEKGETRSPLELWRPLPRFITIQEEIGGLFANFANENSGRGLETAILELYDRDSFTTTATNERSAKSGRLLYSILGGIPKTEWDNIFARSSSVGSGLFSRLNIIGTENDRTVAALPEYDFAEMQRVFLPRITALERTPARIPVSPNARGLLNEWFARLSDEMKAEDLPAARLNIHALRVALHLAWLQGHANILESDVDAGIKVADFQAKMREFYRPAEGETREAQWENRIMSVMRQKRSLAHRELQRLCHADRAGTAVWERAIAGLRRDERIAVVDGVTKAGKKGKTVKLLKRRD
jgi:hypothetical protein